MLSRRRFFAGLTAAAALPVPSWAAAGHPAALGAALLPTGQYALAGLKSDGSLAFTIPLPDRGHAGAAHPKLAEAVVIARRPGSYALVINCARGDVRQTLTTPAGRHFYGHGAFSADGDTLFTTENDIATGEGRIGVWDRRLGYARIDDLASHGIGPHEILRLPNGTLAVANGGIRTHPDTGREKLNLDTMRPNLTILSETGAILDQVSPTEHQNSLRHIATDTAGQVAVGFQWQGDPFDAPPLVAIYKSGQISHLDRDPMESRKLQAYVGSVCRSGADVAVTSPRGGVLQAYDADGALRMSETASDICGLATMKNGALATDGSGRVYRLEAARLSRLSHHELAFDNHLVAL